MIQRNTYICTFVYELIYKIYKLVTVFLTFATKKYNLIYVRVYLCNTTQQNITFCYNVIQELLSVNYSIHNDIWCLTFLTIFILYISKTCNKHSRHKNDEQHKQVSPKFILQ